MKTNPHRGTLGHVKAKALKNSVAVALEQAKPKHLPAHWVMGDVKVKPPVDTFPDNLRPTKAETNLDTLRGVRAKALVDTMAETLQEAKAKTPLDTLDHLKDEILMDTLAGTGRHAG